ncbi:MAG: Calx-beta domain-containing protein, partial [Verrucomicrobiota bacterium]|nr:Calx-beta domain-containing protein [Verrucomicrobiota bacterium]
MNGYAQVLFEDDFNSDTSANWIVLSDTSADENDAAYEAALGDFTVHFAFDYSSRGIPPAPNSGDNSTQGVRISVNNNDDTGGSEAIGVNLFPAKQNFSGNYAVRFDMWINYNGPAGGGTGSTEHAIFGINQSGERVGWSSQPTGDGIWFGVDGEGGSSTDYYSFEADDTGTVSALPPDLAGMIGKNNSHPLYQFLFPAPTFETQGAPGKHWVSVEVRQNDDVLSWVMNGMVIASRPVSAESFGVRSEGTVMLGYMDLFNSIANPKEDNFVIYDNVQVVNMDKEPSLPLLSVEATDDAGVESGGDAIEFTVHRFENTADALTVDIVIRGTATEEADYTVESKSVTFPAGAESASIVVTPVDDKLGEPEETIIASLKLSQGIYEINHEYTATAILADDGDTATVSITASDAQAYERHEGDLILYTLSRTGDDSEDLAVTIKVGGSATVDTDYEGDFADLEIFAFESETIIEVYALDDVEVEGDETIELTVVAGAGYAVGESATATATIRDDDYAEEEIFFSDDFSTDTSVNWDLQFGAINGVEDYTATFAVDYSELSIPSAPHTTDESTLGLFLQVNKNDDTPSGAAGVNVFPKNQVFSGNYAVRFDMFLSAGSGAGTTEHAIFGVNHSGDIVTRNAATGDGVWFGVVTDGSNNRSYASYVGADLKNSLPAADFADLIPSPPYISGLSFSGPGSPSSNGSQPDPVWADIEIRHVDGLVTMKVNQIPIFTVTDRGAFTKGGFMLGMNDQFSSIGSPDTFVIYDNVRVVPLESEGGVTVVSVNATDSVMTEGDSGDTGTIVVSRNGSTDAALTVLLKLSGDAQLGTDYSGAANEIVLPAGSAEVSITFAAIDDDELEAAETIRIDVLKSDAYFVGAAASAVVVLNDNDKENTGPAPEPEVTLWGDNLDSADGTGWIVNKSTDDTAVTFGYDYSADGIPAAPNSNGSTIGVKFEANIADPTGAEAVSISPVGTSFTGDYEVKFDMWINANGPFPGGGGGSTEFFTAGVGTTGDHLQWAADTADGAWFGVTGEGGSGNSGDFRAHIGGARQAAESGAYAAGATADSRNNTNPHYADAFPGQSPPAAQAAAFPDKQTGTLANGAVGFAWRQVSITKIGDSVTWAIDGVTIATLGQSLGAFT